MTLLEVRRRKAIWGLAIAETIVWAGLYYSFAALALRWEQGFGWSKTDIALCFTASVITSAAAAPLAGALIDKGLGPHVSAGAAILGAAALAGLTLVEGYPSFLGLWIVIGAAMAGCLYEPIFALVTRSCGENARRAITHITLVAGFAGALSFPIAAGIAELAGWRASLWLFAGVIVLAAAPLFWRAGASLEASSVSPPLSPPRSALLTALRTPSFWLLALAFSCLMLNHSLLITHLLAILDHRRADPALAVAAAASIGPMQVMGRVLMATLAARTPTLVPTALSFAAVALAALILLWAENDPVMILAFASVQGAGYGLSSVMRPVLSAELLGRAGFGGVSGAMATPVLLAGALAPLLGAALWSDSGPSLAIKAALAAPLIGLAAIAAAWIISRRHNYNKI
ncbi:MAG: MFS transporter [Rhodobacteraceae bacterium]|nr:MFS transporter [Paracoccaceae bacterium]